MKARILVAAILLLVFLIQPLSEIVEANPFSSYFKNQPTWGISSPVNRNSLNSSDSNPIVYKKPSFNISFYIELPNNSTQIDSFSYTINGASSNPLSFTKKDNGLFSYTKYTVFETIDNLKEGIYHLKINPLFANGTTSQFMESVIKIDLSPPLDPLLPLFLVLILLVVLSSATIVFFSRNYTSEKQKR